MDNSFRICKYGVCGISITGSDTYDDYITFDNTITVNILLKVDSEGNKKLVNYEIDEHNDDFDQTISEFPEDGLYEVHHLVVSKSEQIDDNWINAKLEENLTGGVLTFSSCRILECYYKYANNFLQEYCSSGKCFSKTSVEFDIIWIGMHVLKYLLDLGRLYEAQSILNKLLSCSEVCSKSKNYNNKYNGCGC